MTVTVEFADFQEAVPTGRPVSMRPVLVHALMSATLPIAGPRR